MIDYDRLDKEDLKAAINALACIYEGHMESDEMALISVKHVQRIVEPLLFKSGVWREQPQIKIVSQR